MSDQSNPATKGKERAHRIHDLLPDETNSNTAPESATLAVVQAEPILSMTSADSLLENPGNAPVASSAPSKILKKGIKAIFSRTKPQKMGQSSQISSTASVSPREYPGLSGAITVPPINDLRSARIEVSEKKDTVDLETLKNFLELGNKVAGVAGEVANAVPGVSNIISNSLKLISDFLTVLKVVILTSITTIALHC